VHAHALNGGILLTPGGGGDTQTKMRLSEGDNSYHNLDLAKSLLKTKSDPNACHSVWPDGPTARITL
jgi:hypothetical protein